MGHETIPISAAEAVAHECEYRAREARQVVRDWHATSDPVKRAILEDCAKTLEQAEAELRLAAAPEETIEELGAWIDALANPGAKP